MNVVALYPWLMLPVVPVILVVLAFNFLGEGLRDAADPYTSGEEASGDADPICARARS
jgi:peptide/nickel transport system permease protein